MKFSFRQNVIFGLGLFFIFLSSILYAQTPKVPSSIQFAGMTIQLNDQAQRDIQLDVDALCRSERFFNMKLERVNLYMPIIERVLHEQGVPNDIKYLVIQESGLIPDAVSTSNAVGFWQFKKGTAHEVFLQVDGQIDERKNIAASTRGAAIYLKKHNNYFDNWVCALVSYQMGLGGAKNYFGSKYNGHSSMKITKASHWYFKKYLAHKIAFENHIGKFTSNQYLKEVSVQGPITVKALSKNLGISETELKEYNKWITGNKIPEGKSYSLVYLASGTAPVTPLLTSSASSESNSNQYSLPAEGFKNASGYPKITGKQAQPFESGQIKVNGIKGIQAVVNSTTEAFAEKIGIKESKFRRRNDLSKNDHVQRGHYYYTKRKKSKSDVPHHIVQKGETLWSISQAYGIRLHSLKAKNRIYKDEDLLVGMVLNLQKYRGRNEDIKIMTVTPVNQQASSAPSKTKANSSSKQEIQPKLNPVSNNITHTVSQGETLYAIARKYGVSVSEIQTWNNIQNQTVIKIGQKLIIKKN
ncbi:LysM peptidoglycan-binding domain-containing protein [Echinicola marina]|uniref:LysM peptidoglycan-binding domain-containing protein n=1 Tax=Echinicola marina TaxID=2859768 RepID=UPI001CF702B6|nr:LysM peptidoglycan-binding domain-containing protein [Echinicola marina]UCS93513.1 LysM peptidoglycan-binding domain-containing protein [Echinicola marina]